MRSKMEPAQGVGNKKVNVQAEFKAMVSKESAQLRKEELNKLLHELTQQGEKLAKFRNFRDLSQYKRLVKKFMEEATQYGLELKQSRSWNMHGQNRKLTIIETVDEKLVELTELVLDTEKETIDILGKIGEIKGLLINLYT